VTIAGSRWSQGRPRLVAAEPSATATRSPEGAAVWAVGGGKGGIGKSFIASNSATVLARLGLRVILIDVDFGGANLHTCLGVRGTQRVNLSDYFEDRVASLEAAAVETSVPGLRLILGTLGHTGTANTTRTQRTQLVTAIRGLPADVVMLDLAAGMDRATVDFFVESDENLLVTTPEPTAIENAYAFLRASFYRRLGSALNGSPVMGSLRGALAQRAERGLRAPVDVLRELSRKNPDEAPLFQQAMGAFQPRLILNQVRTSDDVRLGFSIASMCRKYFGIQLDYIGYINYDDCVWRSIKDRRTLVVAYPQSDGALYVRQIVKKMLDG